MKATRLFYPVLLLISGLAFGLLGCRSNSAEQPVTTLAPEDSHLTSIPPAPPPSPPASGAGTASQVQTPVAAPPVLATESASAVVGATNAPTGTNAPAAVTASAPTAQVPPQLPALPAAVREVAEMARSGVGESVLLEYVKNSPRSFDIKPEEIVYLKDIGVPETVVVAMLTRTGQLESQGGSATPAAETVATGAQGAAPAEPTPPPAEPSAYATTVTPTAESVPAAPAAAPPTPPTENYYYSSLSPYGSWLYIQPYGWCWQPTVAVVDNGWRPYCQGGRWAYTSDGWYWQSSYSWGWAPFHYGNWYQNPACGWVWVPGSVWAPAWVTWRYSDAYCGWAPLPPGCGWRTGVGLTYYGSGVSVGFSFGLSWSSYTFVGWDHCWGPHPYHYYVPRHHAAVVYNNTTVINNYYGGGKSVINHGIPPARMPGIARQEIHRAELKDIAPGNRAPVRPDQASLEGNKLAVYRPQVPSDLKANSAKRMDPPYAPVRSRSEIPSLTRDFGSPRGPLATPNRERGTVTPYRSPERGGTTIRPGGSTYTAPNRGSLQRSPVPTAPGRSEPRWTPPSAPARVERSAPPQPYSAPGRAPGFSNPGAPQRIETPSTPPRGGPSGSPSAPSRGERPSSPTSRYYAPGNAPYAPPARYAEAVPSTAPTRGATRAYSAGPVMPTPRPSGPTFTPAQPRMSPAPVRSFESTPSSRPSYGNAPAFSAPVQRSAPSGGAPTRARPNAF